MLPPFSFELPLYFSCISYCSFKAKWENKCQVHSSFAELVMAVSGLDSFWYSLGAYGKKISDSIKNLRVLGIYQPLHPHAPALPWQRFSDCFVDTLTSLKLKAFNSFIIVYGTRIARWKYINPRCSVCCQGWHMHVYIYTAINQTDALMKQMKRSSAECNQTGFFPV